MWEVSSANDEAGDGINATRRGHLLSEPLVS